VTDTLDLDDDPVVVVSTPRKPQAVRPASLKDRMRADLQRRRDEAARIVEIAFDDNSFRTYYRVPENGEELAEISARAEKRGKKDGTSGVWFNRLLLARFNVAMQFDGEELADDRGTSWTFAHPEALEFFGASSAPDCVVKAFVSDGAVGAAAMELLAKAGFGERGDIEVVEDPTRKG
jgi:hypothetical protein